jgi:hypothetical protein
MVVRRGEPGARTAPDRDSDPESGPEAGMVTAELALALPTVVLVAVLALSGVQIVMTQVRCRDAAGVAARLAARGESGDVVSAAVTSTAPADSHLAMRREGELVAATVSTELRLLGIGVVLPRFGVTETAVSVVETPDLP